MTVNIALIEPEIPQNTGNIARTCAAVGARLHLVKPLGFEIDDRKLKRAGLDYWNELDITYYENLEEFLNINKNSPMFLFTTKAPRSYTEISYPDGSFIVFGKETKGLPEELLKVNPEKCVRIPMRENLRSLNLSNAVAVATYELLRQTNFESLQNTGEPVSFKW